MDVTNNDRHRKVAVGIFVLYIILLLYFLFFSENLGRTGRIEYRYNFVPFKEIKRFLFNVKILGLKNVIINLGGNIVMYKGDNYNQELLDSVNVIKMFHVKQSDILTYDLKEYGKRRVVVFNKQQTTSNKYPRGGNKPRLDPLH